MGKWLALLIGGLLVVIVILASRGSGDTSTNAPAEPETHVITQDIWGCRDETVLSRISTLKAQGDSAATVNYLRAQIDAGQCITLDRGDTVYLMGSRLLSGITKVRKAGQSAEYWTALEAVR